MYSEDFERAKRERLTAQMEESKRCMNERVKKWALEHPGESYPYWGPVCKPSEKHTRQGHWV